MVSLIKNGYDYVGNDGADTFTWLPANENQPLADMVTNISVIEKGPLAVELRSPRLKDAVTSLVLFDYWLTSHGQR